MQLKVDRVFFFETNALWLANICTYICYVFSYRTDNELAVSKSLIDCQLLQVLAFKLKSLLSPPGLLMLNTLLFQLVGLLNGLVVYIEVWQYLVERRELDTLSVGSVVHCHCQSVDVLAFVNTLLGPARSLHTDTHSTL